MLSVFATSHSALADSPRVVIRSENPLAMQGIGDAVSPQFSNPGDFTFCWGVSDSEDPANSQMGEDAAFSAVSLIPPPATELQGPTTKSKTVATQIGNTLITESETQGTPTNQQKPAETNIASVSHLKSGADSGCKVMTLDPGPHTIHVVATGWTSWYFVITSNAAVSNVGGPAAELVRIGGFSDAQSAVFRAPANWSITYGVDCRQANFPGGSFRITIYNPDGSLSPNQPIQLNNLEQIASDTRSYTNPGFFYLGVTSTCSWSALVTAP
jgi:hypothetical protein